MSDNPNDWSADFAAAEQHRLEGSLMATASQRLQWLEEALRFAAQMRDRARDSDSSAATTTIRSH